MMCEPAVSGVLNTSLVAWPLTSVTGSPIGVASMLNCTVPVGVVVAGATGLTVAVYGPPALVPDALHGYCAAPVSGMVARQTTGVVEAALSIVNVFESLLAVWLASPAKLALPVAVPAAVLFKYETVSDWLRPPAPVTD